MAINTKNILMPTPDAEYKSPEDLRREAWYELRNAWHTGKIMTGKLVSVEEVGKRKIVTTDYKGIRVVIPFEEMNIQNTRQTTEKEPEFSDASLNRIIGGMIGCDIDYVIRGMDNGTDSETVVASRKDAMERKTKIYFLEKRENGYLVNEGDVVGTRILSVTEKNLVIEMFGIVKQLHASDTMYSWIGDMREYYAVGQILPVRIVKLDRTDIAISIEIEIRSLQEDEVRECLVNCEKGMRYAGKVVGCRHGIWFVKLYNGAIIQCKDCKDSRIPYSDDEVSVIISAVDIDKLYALGIITRIIKRNV